jgi:hypothetical protein
VDVGPRDNPVSDWALIGDPEVVPLEPAMRLDLSDKPLDLPYGPPPARLDGLTAADLAGATAAWLCLDSMGVDDGETYATEVTVNGVPCGPIPQGVGDAVWAEGVRIALPEAAVRALRAANEVIIENPRKDCFNVRNVCLRFRLADGREGTSRVAKGPYAADPGWLYAQGTGNRLGSPLPTMLLEVPLG